MDKITDLLKKMSVSDELINEFKLTLSSFEKETRKKINAQLQEAYTRKEQRAKQICLEEVEKEKVRLAERVKTFLESKQKDIEAQAARQHAIEESKAQQILRRVKDTVVGHDPNAVTGNNGDLQESREKFARIEKVLASMKEERDQAVRGAARARKIAEDVLKQNKLLEAKMKAKEKGEKGDKEEKPSAKKPEAKKGAWQKPWEGKKAASESAPQRSGTRIDESRKVPDQARAQRVVSESQTQPKIDADIAQIASTL